MRFIFDQLEVTSELFSAEEKVLWMTGTHGSEDGRSALTDFNQAEHRFYEIECQYFGIKCGPERKSKSTALSKTWPDITKQAEKLKSHDKLHEMLKNFEIRVANIPYYYKNEKKLEEDIKKERLNN